MDIMYFFILSIFFVPSFSILFIILFLIQAETYVLLHYSPAYYGSWSATSATAYVSRMAWVPGMLAIIKTYIKIKYGDRFT